MFEMIRDFKEDHLYVMRCLSGTREVLMGENESNINTS
jgi:hypothetical protein